MITSLVVMKKIMSGIYSVALCLLLASCGGDSDPNGGGSGNLNNRPVGESANDLLTSSNYNRLEVELVYAAGFEPPSASVDYIRNFLAERLNKPGGVSVVTRQISAPGKSRYSLQELVDIETANRLKFNNESTLGVYLFFADGSYAPNENVLGVAYKNTSMVLFQSRIEELSGGIGQSSTSLLTSSVMAHEFGHILGLVNTGSALQSDHQDVANGHHCDVDDCLMYFAVESTAGLNDLLGMSAPPTLDAQCLADLKANGGK